MQTDTIRASKVALRQTIAIAAKGSLKLPNSLTFIK